jgi:hypothetical protein
LIACYFGIEWARKTEWKAVVAGDRIPTGYLLLTVAALHTSNGYYVISKQSKTDFSKTERLLHNKVVNEKISACYMKVTALMI